MTHTRKDVVKNQTALLLWGGLPPLCCPSPLPPRPLFSIPEIHIHKASGTSPSILSMSESPAFQWKNRWLMNLSTWQVKINYTKCKSIIARQSLSSSGLPCIRLESNTIVLNFFWVDFKPAFKVRIIYCIILIFLFFFSTKPSTPDKQTLFLNILATFCFYHGQLFPISAVCNYSTWVNLCPLPG